MQCTGTYYDQETCQVEKMGCTGCYYNRNIEERIKQLETERDYYKARYQEFNDAFIQAGKDMCKEGGGLNGRRFKKIRSNRLPYMWE